jgi:hypothetical protein
MLLYSKLRFYFLIYPRALKQVHIQGFLLKIEADCVKIYQFDVLECIDPAILNLHTHVASPYFNLLQKIILAVFKA